MATVLSEIKSDEEPTPDRLDAIREAVRKMRDKQIELTQLEERARALSKEIQYLRHEHLPELFQEAGTDRIGLPAEGNMPPFDAVLKPYFKANIPVGWEPARRAKGFETLKELGLEHLQLVTFNLAFGRGQQPLAEKLKKLLTEHGFEFSTTLSVNWASLTAALKTMCQKGHMPSDEQLDAIDGQVGNVVDLKVRN